MKNRVLVTTCIISLLVIVYSFFTFGLTNIHSDNAVELLAIRSMFEDKSLFPATWVYGNGDINLMRVQVFILPFYILIPKWSIARECGSLFVLLLSCYSIHLLDKKLLRNKSWQIIIPIYLLFISGTIARDVSMYSAMYTSIMLYINLIVLLIYSVLQANSKEKIRKKILLGVLLFLILIGGIRWIAEITLPLMMTIGVWFLINYSKDRGSISVLTERYIEPALIVLVSSIMGFAVFKHVLGNHMFFVNSQDDVALILSVGQIVRNAIGITKNLFRCFGFDKAYGWTSFYGLRNVVALGSCTLICIIIPIVQLVKIKRENKETQLFLIYGYSHNLVLLSAAILMGKLVEYHVISSIFVFILISGRYIVAYWLEKKHNVLVVTTLVIMCIIEMICMLQNSVGWKKKFDAQRQLVNTITEHNLSKGYASFWNAYNNELYSNGDIRMGGVRFGDDYIEAYYCLCDIKRYEDSYQPTFLIFNEEEMEMYGSKALTTFGPTLYDWEVDAVPVYDHHEYKWIDTNIYVWAWDYDIATRLNNGILDGRLSKDELIFNWLGTKTEDAVIMTQGGVLNGPFSTMQKGNYNVRITGENVQVLSCNIMSENYKDAIEYEELSRTSDSIDVKLILKESIDDINFSLMNTTNQKVVFYGIEINKTL